MSPLPQLPVGNNPATTTAQANPADYEYLCSDGSRQPVDGAATGQPPCTWAQRPWQAYMGNADVRPRAKPLQQKIGAFYEAGKVTASEGDAAAKADASRMWIDARNVVVDKEEHSLPGAHLEAAQYRDVIERDGHMQLKVRLCVRSDVELRKCELLVRVAFARDIRPEFGCVLAADCVRAVHEGAADAVVVAPLQYGAARAQGLVPVVFETMDGENAYVAVVAKELKLIDAATPM